MKTTYEQLPVLNLARLESNPAERDAFIAELRKTAYDLGFFYITGHGIDQALIDDTLAVAKQFFALPEADKMAIEMVNSPHFRGYNRQGNEFTRGQRDWREQVDIGAEREKLAIVPADQPWMRLRGPNQWPANLPNYKETILRYQAAAAALALRLIKPFAIALGQPETSLRQSIRLIHTTCSKSFATPVAMQPRAIRVSVPTKTAGSSPYCSKTSKKGSKSSTTVDGSAHHPSRVRS